MANLLFRKIFQTIGDVENKMNQVLFLIIFCKDATPKVLAMGTVDNTYSHFRSDLL